MRDLRKILFALFLILQIQSTCQTVQSKIIEVTDDSIQRIITRSKFFISNADYDKALIELKELYKLRLQVYSLHHPQIVYSLINIATIYDLKGEADSAIQNLNKAEKILLSVHSPNYDDLGDIYSNLGYFNYKKGEYSFAESYLKLAEKYFQKSYSKNIEMNLARLYLRFLLLFNDSGQLIEARKYLKKAKITIDHIDDNLEYLIYYYLRAAHLEVLTDNIYKSIEYQQAAINICLKDPSSNSSLLLSLYNNVALNYLELNNCKKSFDYFNKALELTKKYDNKGKELANLFANLSHYYITINNPSKSLQYSQKSLQALFPEMDLSNNFVNPELSKITPSQEALEAFKYKTNALYALFLRTQKTTILDASINTGFLMLLVIEELRNGYLTFESKLKINEHEDATFKTLADYVSKAYQLTKDKKYLDCLFEISERNKSSLLLFSLGELKAKRFGEIPEELLNKEKYLKKRIAFYKEQVYEEKQLEQPDTNKLETWGSYLFDSERSLVELTTKFEKEYPNYYALKYSNKNYKIENLQEILPRKTTIIEYIITDSLLHTLVVSGKSCNYYFQKTDSSFNHLVTDYLTIYQNFDFSQQFYSGFTEFCWQSKELYKHLIGPIVKNIKNEKLIIVPDGILSYIPFETLIENMPETVPDGYFKNLPYLITKYDISYSYSAMLFNDKQNDKHFKIRDLVAFAPEYSSATEMDYGNTRKLVTRQKYRKNLYPIPGVKEEVNSIEMLINSDLYIGEEATETNFKSIASGYDILHLAMHTVIDNKDPMYSKLIFTINNDTLNDGFLNTHEIFGLNLNARMVVLSACSTGEGEYSKGEGALSLARGFAYAGVPSLVMTLWEVEDKSGAQLMKDFYINLLKGQSKSNALRNAKIKFIRESKLENSHPFFWSSFVVVGNPVSLTMLREMKILIIIIVSASIISFLIYWYSRKKASSSAPS